MPRQFRTLSSSKIYHIIFKGIDDTNIFYTSEDKSTFLEKIKLSKKEFPFKIYAYCLMNNHVHLIIEAESNMLSKSMKSLLIRYVYYFNKTYQRKGPLFQNRFYSKNVENQDYFLSVCRYVHRNPEKAGIAKTEKYKWSSYNEYIGNEKIINKKVLMHYFNNDISEFIKYTTRLEVEEMENLYDYAEYEIINRLSDEELIQIIMKKFKICDMNEFANFFKTREKENLENDIKIIKKIKGSCKSQVARVIRVNKRIVSKAWDAK